MGGECAAGIVERLYEGRQTADLNRLVPSAGSGIRVLVGFMTAGRTVRPLRDEDRGK